MGPIDNAGEQVLEGARRVALAIYALQAASFIAPIALIAALVLGYLKRSDVEGTWLESHFRWQIRTIWFGLLWSALALLTVVIGVGYLIGSANAVWIVYRIVKGWLRLSERRPV